MISFLKDRVPLEKVYFGLGYSGTVLAVAMVVAGLAFATIGSGAVIVLPLVIGSGAVVATSGVFFGFGFLENDIRYNLTRHYLVN
jgi:hypothetical protein